MGHDPAEPTPDWEHGAAGAAAPAGTGPAASSPPEPAHPHFSPNPPEAAKTTESASQSPPQPSESTEPTDGELFGANLEPVLQQACAGRLSPIRWFRTDWQRGGALTGAADYASDDGHAHPVVVKVPVPPRERYRLTELQGEFDVVPRVYAHGEQLNGYDLAWVVMEALPHGPLSPDWAGAEFDLLTEAAGRFYAATEAVIPPRDSSRMDRDWARLLELAQKQVRHGSVPEAGAWKQALKKAGRKLEDWLAQWQQRPIEQWCHGDLHLANAMTRSAPPAGPAVLLDLAQVRPGHWVEDAVYFEHLYWARPDRLGGRKLCKQIAKQRKALGLELDPHWAEYARIKRALLAMTTPARLDQDGDPRHLPAVLELLERHVK